ncbi:hypothetical protein KUCAC02_033924 [Chaenocephalus aceratus]|nr:hypothetical protein KUCAC02_033924 [Chaenocephalus aceratus]
MWRTWAEDCSAVRSQLEFLQKLLLQEEDTDEDTLTTEDSEISSLTVCVCVCVCVVCVCVCVQVQVLLQEVQQLREDLRSRDRTIAQLTLQLKTVPIVTDECCCREKTEHHTQTSSAERESALPPCFLSPPWQYQRSKPFRARPKPSIPPHRASRREEHLVLYFSDTACSVLQYQQPPPGVSAHLRRLFMFLSCRTPEEQKTRDQT